MTAPLLPPIAETFAWRMENNTLVVLHRSLSGTRTTTLDEAALSTVQPDLFTALTNIMEYRQRVGHTGSSIPLLHAQVAYLQTPYQFKTITGKVVHACTIQRVLWNKSHDYARLHLTLCELGDELPATAEYAAVPVPPFVKKTNTLTVGVPSDEMERYFPGWQNRYVVGAGLDLSMEEHVNFVCQRPASDASADLTGITFKD